MEQKTWVFCPMSKNSISGLCSNFLFILSILTSQPPMDKL
jgi:hypothetical protein